MVAARETPPEGHRSLTSVLSAIGGADRQDALTMARRIAAERFASAGCVILGDTVLGDAATRYSDLDMFIVGTHAQWPMRNTEIIDGWPVELFCHTEVSWPEFRDREVRERHVALLSLVASGVVVTDRDGRASALQAEARELMEAGPAPLGRVACERARHALTDCLLDLVAADGSDETFGCVLQLSEVAMQLLADSSGVWPGRGKRWVRVMRTTDPEALELWIAALGDLTERRDARRMREFGEHVLARAGGAIYDGYRASVATTASAVS